MVQALPTAFRSFGPKVMGIGLQGLGFQALGWFCNGERWLYKQSRLPGVAGLSVGFGVYGRVLDLGVVGGATL